MELDSIWLAYGIDRLGTSLDINSWFADCCSSTLLLILLRKGKLMVVMATCSGFPRFK